MSYPPDENKKNKSKPHHAQRTICSVMSFESEIQISQDEQTNIIHLSNIQRPFQSIPERIILQDVLIALKPQRVQR